MGQARGKGRIYTYPYPAAERHNSNALLMGHGKHLKGLLW